MSLRAKIEAVIYAAEEPVTLIQLAAIFADEVRELQQAANRSDGDAAALVPAPEAAPDNTTAATEATALEEAMAHESASTASEDPEAAAAKRAARQQERAIREYLRGVIEELMGELDAADRGVEIREIAGGYRMATRPEYHDAIRSFVKSLKPPMKLSLQALETLAVVAYKQPVTSPEISEIRGVESAGVLGSLMARKLITTAGRKQVIGRPILYKTTREFLLRFGLRDLNELPSIEEFEKMAGELAEDDLAEAPSEPLNRLSHAQADSSGSLGLEEIDTDTGSLPDRSVLQQESSEQPSALRETLEEKAGEA